MSAGQIYVGGVGVALGYLDKTVSDQRFVENPFTTGEEKERGWTSTYRTGDKGLIRADGGLQFMGRMDGDRTVKLRGLRIDLDDVANVMLREFKASITDTVVTVHGDPAFIVAHVVLASDACTSSDDLQGYGNSLPLPQYMKPAIVIPLEKLPLNNNGKVDRRAVAALPLPDATFSAKPKASSSTRKATLVEGELRLIWNNVLSQTRIANIARLEPDTDFFHVGGNSLLLVRLRSAIQTSMGVTLQLSDMYRSSTLDAMAALITEQKRTDFVPETIDWEAETALPRSTDFARRHDTTPLRPGDRLEVLMTGSTAFLGREILTSLLKNSAVARVYCVAVDPDSEVDHIKDDRVTLYPGSLSETMLGLKSDIYQQLQASVDAIILAGSEGHCLNNYSTLRGPNVHSTRHMDAALPPVSVRDHRPPADGSEGFTAAKWAGEVFLENLSTAAAKSSDGAGLPVTIHRPCAVVGDEAPIEDALNALLRYSKLIAAVPRVSGLNVRGYFDFLPATDVANAIAESALSQPSHSVTTFRHHSSGVRVTPSEFATYMQKTCGGEFRKLNLEDWIDEARKEGIEELIVLYLQAIVERGERITFPFMGNTD